MLVNQNLSGDASTSWPSAMVSILCLTYNHEKYLATALDSFLAQVTNFKFDIVVGEDCSSDKTHAILKRYQEENPGKIFIVQPASNVGITQNFRATLAHCTGKYIAFCEGDDYWTDVGKLQQQVDFMERNADYVITYHRAQALLPSGELTRSRQFLGNEKDLTREQIQRAAPLSSLTTCFRNLVPQIPREFDQAPVLDLCIWSLLGQYGKGKYLESIAPAVYRIHSDGVFSLQSRANKFTMTALSFICLSRYHARVGNRALSQHFLVRANVLLGAQLGLLSKLKAVFLMLAESTIRLIPLRKR